MLNTLKPSILFCVVLKDGAFNLKNSFLNSFQILSFQTDSCLLTLLWPEENIFGSFNVLSI